MEEYIIGLKLKNGDLIKVDSTRKMALIADYAFRDEIETIVVINKFTKKEKQYTEVDVMSSKIN